MCCSHLKWCTSDSGQWVWGINHSLVAWLFLHRNDSPDGFSPHYRLAEKCETNTWSFCQGIQEESFFFFFFLMVIARNAIWFAEHTLQKGCHTGRVHQSMLTGAGVDIVAEVWFTGLERSPHSFDISSLQHTAKPKARQCKQRKPSLCAAIRQRVWSRLTIWLKAWKANTYLK